MEKISEKWLEFPVMRGTVLGVTVFRGYAKLSDLSRISKADVYDQVKNPKGTQRDLNTKHASEAYLYVKNNEFGFWPEVFLCARQSKVIEFHPTKNLKDIGLLRIKTNMIRSDTISISRVDGNHRLYYADGSDSRYPAIDKIVSFCMAYDLSMEQEIVLFRDINNNQRAMSTTHLDGIKVRLTKEEELKKSDPALYIASKLADDRKSPLVGRVHKGGKKAVDVDIPLRALQSGIKYMIPESKELRDISDNVDAQYKLIRNYFAAVKKWQPQAWTKPKSSILLRGAGLWAACLIGAQVIDRVMNQGNYKMEDMLKILKSGKDWDWSGKGDFRGLSGRVGAGEISRRVSQEFFDESRKSTKEILQKIMSDD